MLGNITRFRLFPSYFATARLFIYILPYKVSLFNLFEFRHGKAIYCPLVAKITCK